MIRSILEAFGLMRPKVVLWDVKQRAYKEGMAGRFDNPYVRGTPEWKSWRLGLQEAESDTAMSI
ncbi:hypothetical protein YK56LOC_59080 [Caballeronia sp. HLA56]